MYFINVLVKNERAVLRRALAAPVEAGEEWNLRPSLNSLRTHEKGTYKREKERNPCLEHGVEGSRLPVSDSLAARGEKEWRRLLVSWQNAGM